MASTLRMRATIAPRKWQSCIAVLSLLKLINMVWPARSHLLPYLKIGTCASVNNLVLESRIQEYLELPYIGRAGAWKLNGSRKEPNARGRHERGEGAPSPLACLPLARPFFLAPKYFQVPATQVWGWDDCQCFIQASLISISPCHDLICVLCLDLEKHFPTVDPIAMGSCSYFSCARCFYVHFRFQNTTNF